MRHPTTDRPVSSSCAPRDPARRRLLAAGAAGTLGLGGVASLAAASGSGRQAEQEAPGAGAGADVEAAGPQGAGFYRTMVGDVEIALVGDGGWVGDASAIGTNATAEERAAACRDAFLDPDALPGGVHCLLIRHPDATLLVDVGCGELFGPGAGFLATHLSRTGVQAADVDAVVLTHLHPDHVGGLLGERGATVFGDAMFHLSDVELRFWMDEPSLERSAVGDAMKDTMRSVASAALSAITRRVEPFTAGAELVPGVRTLALPGHTPGHVGLEIDRGGETLVFMSDVLHNAAMQLPNPGWHVAFDVDSVQAAATRSRLLDRAAAERLRLCGSHLPFPAFGHVARDGTGYRWVPEPWRWNG